MRIDDMTIAALKDELSSALQGYLAHHPDFEDSHEPEDEESTPGTIHRCVVAIRKLEEGIRQIRYEDGEYPDVEAAQEAAEKAKNCS